MARPRPECREKLDTYVDRFLNTRAHLPIYKNERTYWRLHSFVVLADVRLHQAKPDHVKRILDSAVKGGAGKQTVKHIKSFLSRVFASAWRDGLVRENIVDRVQLPRIVEVKKARVLVSDEEFYMLVMHPETDEELRVMAVLARIVGGMRAGDLHALRWEAITTPSFKGITVPRSKTKTPQLFEIPLDVKPFLHAWWERHGKPGSGWVFPCQRGERVGQRKAADNSYADKLRRELRRVGITRPELFVETETTLPTDFHSFRRKFISVLADAGVPTVKAMALASHTSVKTHARYVVGLTKIPAAAVPYLGDKNQSGTRDSNSRPSAWEASPLPQDPTLTTLVTKLQDDPMLLQAVLAKLLT